MVSKLISIAVLFAFLCAPMVWATNQEEEEKLSPRGSLEKKIETEVDDFIKSSTFTLSDRVRYKFRSFLNDPYQSLSLKDSIIRDENFEKSLIPVLNLGKKMISLNCSGNLLTEKIFEYSFDLEKIDLSDNKFSLNVNNIQVFPNIEKVIFDDNCFLKGFKGLKYLSINNCKVTDSDLQVLLDNDLVHLSAKKNNITQEGAEIILAHKRLISLDLSLNPIEDFFSHSLAKSKNIKSLSLYGVKVEDKFLESLTKNVSLEYLNIISSRINEDKLFFIKNIKKIEI